VQHHALVPQPTALRTFAVARPDGYVVMSGALGHVGPAPQAAGGAVGTAKDVWVLAPEPADAGLVTNGVLPGRAPGAAVSRRAGEELFRLGRHTERAESTVRLLLAVADRWDDFARATDADARRGTPAGAGPAALAVLLAALHELAADASLGALVTDATLHGSVAWSVTRMAQDAAGVRDNLSPDVWRAISALERTLRAERQRQLGDGENPLGPAPSLARLLEALMALTGGFTESLVRDVGWHLLEAGRRLERAKRLVATLAATVTVPRDDAVERLVLESVLLANESALTYRRRHPGGGLAGALDLLLADATNPRALAFQLEELRAHLAELPAMGRGPASRDQLLGEARDLLTELRTGRAAHEHASGRRVFLEQTLESIGWRLEELATEISRVHFTRPVVAQWPGGWS
jgi:uncharacterized alpha-E superfamily protein